MLKRIRLVWFTIGCSVSAAGISAYYLKDLWAQQHSLQSQMKHQFESLEARIRDLESIASQASTPPPTIPPQTEE